MRRMNSKSAICPASPPKPHLELAKWCLRHDLYAKCSEQIVAAMRARAGQSRAKDLETRLKLIVEAPAGADPR